MKIAAKVLIISLLIGAGASLVWMQIFQSVAVRYRLTIEIETPEGIKVGSVVRQISVQKNLARYLNPEVNTLDRKVVGEAVVVDLGGRGRVFGLIDWDSFKEVETAFPSPLYDLNYYARLKLGQVASITVNQPRMVTFSVPTDPSTAKLVYENKLYGNSKVKTDDFEKVFGVGVFLKQVSVEISVEPITFSDAGQFPFIYPPERFVVWQRSLKYGDRLTMGRSNFIKIP